MKLLFDTSVLVAALHAGHEHHARAKPWLAAVDRSSLDGLITTHAIAETWATLSRLPIAPRLTPAQAFQVVARLDQAFSVVALDLDLYRGAIDRCAGRGFSSGSVFDALHLVAAEREKVDSLLTFNQRDFERLTVSSSPEILVPPESPPTFD